MIVAETSNLRIDVVGDEQGAPGVIWIEDSLLVDQPSNGMMVGLEEVPNLLSELARITGISPGRPYQVSRASQPSAGHALEVSLVDSKSTGDLPEALAHAELPLIAVRRTAGSQSCFGVWPDEAATFRDGMLSACDEFRAWEATSLYNSGTTRLKAGRKREAIPIFKQALQIDPGHFLAAFNLAMCYDLMGQIQEAWHWYERASELDPSDPDPVYNMADILFRQRRFSQAESLCREALRLFEEQFRTAQITPYAPWDLDVSIDQLLADIALKKAGADYLMAYICASQGKLQTALESAEQAVSIHPHNAHWWLLIAQLQNDLGNRYEAQRAFTRATEIDPGIARKAFGHGGR